MDWHVNAQDCFRGGKVQDALVPKTGSKTTRMLLLLHFFDVARGAGWRKIFANGCLVTCNCGHSVAMTARFSQYIEVAAGAQSICRRRPLRADF